MNYLAEAGGDDKRPPLWKILVIGGAVYIALYFLLLFLTSC